MELALFWAFSGHAQRGLISIEKLETRTAISGSMARFICGKSSREDLNMLKEWARSPYMNRILQSLWVKSLYVSDGRISEDDRDWLADFPPRMNREYFVPFASMLGWLYLRNGLHEDVETLANMLKDEYAHESDILQIRKALQDKREYVSDARYWKTRFKNNLKNFAKRCVYYL